MKKACKDLIARLNGFVKGVCHPKDAIDELKEAGLEWVRWDISFPLDRDGNESRDYRDFVNRAEAYQKQGVRSIVVTPYPSEFLAHGIDVRKEEGLAACEEICARMASDCAPLGFLWQITNEMHVLHFRAPLSKDEAVRFLIACLRGIRRGDPNACIGHNSIDGGWFDACRQIREEAPCDYVGVDLYDGTWTQGGVESFSPFLDRVYEEVGLPIILMEFGFSSMGGVMEDPVQEMRDFAAEMGIAVTDLASVAKHRDALIAALPEQIKGRVEACAEEDKLGCLLSSLPHVRKKWPCAGRLPHTEEGQARFYDELLPILMAHPHLAGAVIYCMTDSRACFFCGEEDCPCEIAWGLLRTDRSKKPAFEAVKRHFASP